MRALNAQQTGCRLVSSSSSSTFNSCHQTNNPSPVCPPTQLVRPWPHHAKPPLLPISETHSTITDDNLLWSCAPVRWYRALRNASSSRRGGEPDNVSSTNHRGGSSSHAYGLQMAENHEARWFTSGHLLHAYIKAEDITKPFQRTESIWFFIYVVCEKIFPIICSRVQKNNTLGPWNVFILSWPITQQEVGDQQLPKQTNSQQGKKNGRNFEEKQLEEFLSGGHPHRNKAPKFRKSERDTLINWTKCALHGASNTTRLKQSHVCV